MLSALNFPLPNISIVMSTFIYISFSRLALHIYVFINLLNHYILVMSYRQQIVGLLFYGLSAIVSVLGQELDHLHLLSEWMSLLCLAAFFLLIIFTCFLMVSFSLSPLLSVPYVSFNFTSSFEKYT